MLYLFDGFVTSLGMTLAKLSRLLIASSREFIADAEAVRMTKNPAALISALKRIDGRSEINGLDQSVDTMMIDGAVDGGYATHPTIADRMPCWRSMRVPWCMVQVLARIREFTGNLG